MAFSNPSGLFIGALKPEDKKFILALLKNARKAGYERFVEPCAGALAMSYLAAEAGFDPTKIEASDVSYFSAAFGRGVMRTDTSDMGIEAEGFTAEELLDPATALYAQAYLRMTQKAGVEFYIEYLRDLKMNRERHVQHIQEQIDEISAKCYGMTYMDMDINDHIDRVLDDEKAVIVACVPTYTAGYERFFDTGGKLSWNEPAYDIWDVKTSLRELFEKAKDAKALLLVYEETKQGENIGEAIYGRAAGRPEMNMYITTNRPEEAIALLKGKSIFRKEGTPAVPCKCSIIPQDYEITENSKIEVGKIKSENVWYYRTLWTHNFVGTTKTNGYALYIDGYIASVFGYYNMLMLLRYSYDLDLLFGVSAPFHMRLNRLLYMVATKREIVLSAIDDILKEYCTGVATTMITKYPESKEMRGIMKLFSREEMKPCGYTLRYRTDLHDKSLQEILKEWLQKEKKWQSTKAK